MGTLKHSGLSQEGPHSAVSTTPYAYLEVVREETGADLRFLLLSVNYNDDRNYYTYRYSL